MENILREIEKIRHQTDKIGRLRRWIEDAHNREKNLMDQINVLKNDRHELNNTISDLKEQLRAAKAAGLHAQHAGGKMDADLKQYITGLIREIDKSLKNWED